MSSEDHPPQQALVKSLIASISGFTPETTGGICDGCNCGLSEGDDVYVYADWHGNWRLTRTSCADCGDRLDDRNQVEAIAKCELGHSPNNEVYPLHNPEVVQMNTSEGAVLR